MGDDREDEVGFPERQEVVLDKGPSAQSLAGQSAGGYGVLGAGDMVAPVTPLQASR
jgi:hypothetical protein